MSEAINTPTRQRVLPPLLASAVVSALVAAGVALFVAGLTKPFVTTIVDEGEVKVPIRGGSEPAETQVFYKAPFASPPKLLFPSGLSSGEVEVVEQKADSFKLRSVRRLEREEGTLRVQWCAEGIPATPK